jgi:two-component system sensor histidine kinase DesK
VGLHVVVAAGLVPAILVSVVWTSSWSLRLLAFAGAAVLAAAHLVGFWRDRTRFPKALVLVQVVAALLPAVVLGPFWLLSTGYLASVPLQVWRPVRAIPVAAAICVVTGVLCGLNSAGPRFMTGLSFGGTTALITLGLCGIVLSARLLVAHDEERGELEHRVVADERRRFARDLHDLLGLSLSAITLKGELVDRLIAQHPDRARAELGELLTMSRKALADVRSISSGYRDLSLDDDCRVAATVLRAADVEALVSQPPPSLPPRVVIALAAVLREGVTNVVRHSNATWCRCEIRVVDDVAWLEVVNDGVLAAVAPAADCGAGLRNLRGRVSELGGRLTAGVDADGSFRLRACIPLPGERSVRSSDGLAACGR